MKQTVKGGENPTPSNENRPPDPGPEGQVLANGAVAVTHLPVQNGGRNNDPEAPGADYNQELPCETSKSNPKNVANLKRQNDSTNNNDDGDKPSPSNKSRRPNPGLEGQVFGNGDVASISTHSPETHLPVQDGGRNNDPEATGADQELLFERSKVDSQEKSAGEISKKRQNEGSNSSPSNKSLRPNPGIEGQDFGNVDVASTSTHSPETHSIVRDEGRNNREATGAGDNRPPSNKNPPPGFHDRVFGNAAVSATATPSLFQNDGRNNSQQATGTDYNPQQYDSDKELPPKPMETSEGDSQDEDEKSSKNVANLTKQLESKKKQFESKEAHYAQPTYSSMVKGVLPNQSPVTRSMANEKKMPKDVNRFTIDFPEKTNDTIEVNFEVLLCSDFHFDHDRDEVYILFGKPVSDFEAFMVGMMPIKNKMMKSDYVYLKGTLELSRGFLGDNIPYKYAVVKGGSKEVEWEHIHTWSNSILNRCLNVPKEHQAGLGFPKLDDVIWKKSFNPDMSKFANARCRSMKVMFPDLDDLIVEPPMQSIEAMLYRVMTVVASFDFSGPLAQKTIMDKAHHCENYIPTRFSIMDGIRPYVTRVINMMLEDNHPPVVRFKIALFLALLKYQRCVNKFSDYIIISLFEAFKIFAQAWAENGPEFMVEQHLPKEGMFLALALVNVAQDWLKTNDLSRLKDGGYNWIYAVPFIHFWGYLDNGWLDEVFKSHFPQPPVKVAQTLLKIDPGFSSTFLVITLYDRVASLVIKKHDIINELRITDLLCRLMRFGFKHEIEFDQLSEALQELVIPKLNEYPQAMWQYVIRSTLAIWNRNPSRGRAVMEMAKVLLLLADNVEVTEEISDELEKCVSNILRGLRLDQDDFVIFNAQVLLHFKTNDQQAYVRLLNNFAVVVISDSNAKQSLMTYISHADKFPDEASEILLKNSREILDQKKDSGMFSRFWDGIKKMVIGEREQDNLGKIIARCVAQNVNDVQNFEEAVLLYTSESTLTNLLGFVPMIRDKIDQSTKKKLTTISENVKRFIANLESGQVKIKTILAFKSTPEMERRLQELNGEGDIKSLAKLRIQEAERVTETNTRIKNFVDKVSTHFKLNHDCKDPQHEILATLCSPRKLMSDDKRIVRKGIVSDQNLETIDRFLELYNASRLFR
jgi:hypothetical protein